ncbi:Cupin domain-containing protein [Brevibacterium siliguriense]|uniref:Cupin domain-containing protein n=1 Tax=Brevibacterium siliguriense TaxID=1136497 RepID=A0A1H1V4Z1_9MICO|nr:XRE family transcriptional regulator [Brevibacterium siliguriense]SDS79782.1 Cupin domain-containing protein [Brevibacterium siliguriense]
MAAESKVTLEEHTQRVGTAIRRIRTARGLSLREAAAKTGLSSSFLSLVERGLNSPSLTTLFTLAEALEVTAGELIGETSTKPKPRFAVARSDRSDGLSVSLGDRTYRVLTGSLPGQSLEALRTTIHPTPHPSSPSSHNGEEFCYVLDGELTFHFTSASDAEASETVVVGTGDSIHFQSSSTHSIHNMTSQSVEALWIVDHPLMAPLGT